MAVYLGLLGPIWVRKQLVRGRDSRVPGPGEHGRSREGRTVTQDRTDSEEPPSWSPRQRSALKGPVQGSERHC